MSVIVNRRVTFRYEHVGGLRIVIVPMRVNRSLAMAVEVDVRHHDPTAER